MTERDALPLALIAAVARNGVIGADNAMPWRLPTDLRRFKTLTLGKPVLMGRKTWDSIGRPLPGRHVIVVTHQDGFRAEGVEVVTTIEAAIERGTVAAHALGAAEVMVAGGGTLYRAFIGRAARLYITTVAAEPAGDTLFPAIDDRIWQLIESEVPPPNASDSAALAFLTYGRF